MSPTDLRFLCQLKKLYCFYWDKDERDLGKWSVHKKWETHTHTHTHSHTHQTHTQRKSNHSRKLYTQLKYSSFLRYAIISKNKIQTFLEPP